MWQLSRPVLFIGCAIYPLSNGLCTMGFRVIHKSIFAVFRRNKCLLVSELEIFEVDSQFAQLHAVERLYVQHISDKLLECVSSNSQELELEDLGLVVQAPRLGDSFELDWKPALMTKPRR